VTRTVLWNPDPALPALVHVEQADMIEVELGAAELGEQLEQTRSA
jgi:hypothetical protein